MPVFEDPRTSLFWLTHCQRCADGTPQIELAALEGECERCARKCIAMAQDCLSDPDGPVPEVCGEWQNAPSLYFDKLDAILHRQRQPGEDG